MTLCGVCRNPSEACCVKLDVIDSIFRSAAARQLVEDVLYAWQMRTRTRNCTQQLLKLHRKATEAQAAHETKQAEASAAADRAYEHVHAVGDGFAKLLSVQHGWWALRESFYHWRCVADGFVLPCLRKNGAVEPDSCEDKFSCKKGSAHRQRSRMRRKAWMWWVGQVREMVIRRMQVESWVSLRELEAVQFAWRTWNDAHHVHKNVRHAQVMLRIFVRREKQVSLALLRSEFLCFLVEPILSVSYPLHCHLCCCLHGYIWSVALCC